MNWKLFTVVFGSVFVAELGDKTQLATLLFAAKSQNPRLTVFLAASLALICTSALGVLGGAFISNHVPQRVLSWIAGSGFMLIGAWTILRA